MMDTYRSADHGRQDIDMSAIKWGEATTEESKKATSKSLANSAKLSAGLKSRGFWGDKE
ncbi:hypothetical protein F5Y12DRAFT_717749 [Xylaria sp. FL1777]|nr:hypothetical protein F5Y12DRAFT_717749 [Xylaria sp. FL1777]